MEASSPATSTNRSFQGIVFRKTMAIFSLIALLAVPAFLLVVLQRSKYSQLLRAGDSIPVAILNGLDPGDVLRASIDGRCAAILFFSADCPHCQREIPIFNEAMKRFGSDVEFVAIALNDQQKTRAFVQTNDIKARVIVDEKGLVGKVFGISELPALFLVSDEQKVEWVGVGEQPRTELFRRLSKLKTESRWTITQGANNSRK